MGLLHNIRFHILFLSFLLSIVIFLGVNALPIEQYEKSYTLLYFFAFISLEFLYFALFVGPLVRVFPTLTINQRYLKARRALGVSACYFAILHVRFALFDYLGGLEWLWGLDARYQGALVLSLFSLFILFLLAITSFDYVIAKLTFKRWKYLHRFVYIAGLGILIHAFLIGQHFQNWSSPIPYIALSQLGILLLLHAISMYKNHQKYGRFL